MDCGRENKHPVPALKVTVLLVLLARNVKLTRRISLVTSENGSIPHRLKPVMDAATE
jgi:hypothetical protein